MPPRTRKYSAKAGLVMQNPVSWKQFACASVSRPGGAKADPEKIDDEDDQKAGDAKLFNVAQDLADADGPYEITEQTTAAKCQKETQKL